MPGVARDEALLEIDGERDDRTVDEEEPLDGADDGGQEEDLDEKMRGSLSGRGHTSRKAEPPPPAWQSRLTLLPACWGLHAPTQGGHRYRGENGLFLKTLIEVPSRAPNSNRKAVRSVSRETLQLWSIRPARRRSFFGLENGHLRHQIIKKIRCAALMKAAPYRARGNLF